jgi:hypothetical protein
MRVIEYLGLKPKAINTRLLRSQSRHVAESSIGFFVANLDAPVT